MAEGEVLSRLHAIQQGRGEVAPGNLPAELVAELEAEADGGWVSIRHLTRGMKRLGVSLSDRELAAIGRSLGDGRGMVHLSSLVSTLSNDHSGPSIGQLFSRFSENSQMSWLGFERFATELELSPGLLSRETLKVVFEIEQAGKPNGLSLPQFEGCVRRCVAAASAILRSADTMVRVEGEGEGSSR
eukprot:TRINITY_DN6655_c0_g1_i2.p1 TRINITY_DN6655_c0_g1~~TRINITY_DN6655_c0_g1_i2.p1  ORF type:complete len:186 (-),score=27.94 TRINITY_DN6655_c0_g1_i2:580-1137(-)